MSSIDEKLCPYEMVKKLGSGSFADVWKAFKKEGDGKPFAIKRVMIDRMFGDQTLQEVDRLRKVQG